MANVDRPNGFSFAKSLYAAPSTGLVREYPASDRSTDNSNNHGDIYVGDPVTLAFLGGVRVANTGEPIVGIVVAVGSSSTPTWGRAGPFNPDNLSQRYLPYDQDGNVWVMQAQGLLFEAQSAGVLNRRFGQVADFNIEPFESHGSRITGLSTAEIVVAADPGSADVTIVEQVLNEQNDTGMANARYWVKFNRQDPALSDAGVVSLVQAGPNITVDDSDPRAPIVSGASPGGRVDSIVAGDNVTIDDSDPANPVVTSADPGGQVDSITAGDNVTIDDSDPANPIVTSADPGGQVDSIVAGAGIDVDNTNPEAPEVSVTPPPAEPRKQKKESK